MAHLNADQLSRALARSREALLADPDLSGRLRHAGAIEHVLRNGVPGETYNIPGSAEMANRDVVAALLERLGKPWSLVRSVPDRPGHDRRYALDGSKLAALGWRNRTSFVEGLATTVDWFRANEAWWRAARSGDWGAYYERQYGSRLSHGKAVAETRAPSEV